MIKKLPSPDDWDRLQDTFTKLLREGSGLERVSVARMLTLVSYSLPVPGETAAESTKIILDTLMSNDGSSTPLKRIALTVLNRTTNNDRLKAQILSKGLADPDADYSAAAAKELPGQESHPELLAAVKKYLLGKVSKTFRPPSTATRHALRYHSAYFAKDVDTIARAGLIDRDCAEQALTLIPVGSKLSDEVMHELLQRARESDTPRTERFYVFQQLSQLDLSALTPPEAAELTKSYRAYLASGGEAWANAGEIFDTLASNKRTLASTGQSSADIACRRANFRLIGQ